MNDKRRGQHSIVFDPAPVIISRGSVVGKKEGEGPLGSFFDVVEQDAKLGQSSFEQGESRLQRVAISTALSKAKLEPGDLDIVFSGDLLNQCIGSTFGLRDMDVPFVGLYGACSTMAEGLMLASMAVSGGFARRAAAMTSSHFASAERQYRYPLEYGGQRTPTAQWTVTGSAALLLATEGSGARVTGATAGCIVDKGVKDANNMGAAMAPAACDTILTHLSDMGRSPADYDLIVTGDLGSVGKELTMELLRKSGCAVGGVYDDCGAMIFDLKKQDVHAGGSGCGCSAVVLAAYILPRLESGKFKNVLFCGTGALLSPVSTQQGESIPAICHAVSLSAPDREHHP